MPLKSWMLSSPKTTMNDRMDNYSLIQAGPGSAIHEARGCLVVPVDPGLDEDALEELGKEVLKRVGQSRTRRVIVNVSGVSLLSSWGFTILKRMATAAGMMGSTTVFAGFRAGVVSALVDLDVDVSGIFTVGTMEEAFDIMEKEPGHGSRR